MRIGGPPVVFLWWSLVALLWPSSAVKSSLSSAPLHGLHEEPDPEFVKEVLRVPCSSSPKTFCVRERGARRSGSTANPTETRCEPEPEPPLPGSPRTRTSSSSSSHPPGGSEHPPPPEDHPAPSISPPPAWAGHTCRLCRCVFSENTPRSARTRPVRNPCPCAFDRGYHEGRYFCAGCLLLRLVECNRPLAVENGAVATSVFYRNRNRILRGLKEVARGIMLEILPEAISQEGFDADGCLLLTIPRDADYECPGCDRWYRGRGADGGNPPAHRGNPPRRANTGPRLLRLHRDPRPELRRAAKILNTFLLFVATMVMVQAPLTMLASSWSEDVVSCWQMFLPFVAGGLCDEENKSSTTGFVVSSETRVGTGEANGALIVLAARMVLRIAIQVLAVCQSFRATLGLKDGTGLVGASVSSDSGPEGRHWTGTSAMLRSTSSHEGSCRNGK